MDGIDETLLEIEHPHHPPDPPLAKVFNFYVTVAGGMEDVALAELKQKLGKVSDLRIARGRRMSRIFFHYERTPKKLLELCSVAHVYALLANISGVTVGPPGLLRIAQRVGQVDLVPAAVLHDILHGIKDEVGFRLSCTTGKGHRFSASELHQVVQTVLTLKYEVDDRSNRPYILHLRVEGNRALFGLQLMTQKERDRSYYPVKVRGDFEPSVAYCLAQLLRLRSQDVLLNLTCGGGQTLIEAGLSQMPGLKVGLDFFLDTVAGMVENASCSNVSVSGLVGEGTDLPIVKSGVNKVIGNLVPRKGSNPVSLAHLFSELERVILPDGQAFLIFDDRQMFTRLIEDFPRLKVIKRRPLHLQGKHLDLFILQRQ